MLTLNDVIEALTNTRPAMELPVITEAAIDSRQVIPGSLFVAIPGEKVDGHDYVADAFRQRDLPEACQGGHGRGRQAVQLVLRVEPQEMQGVVRPDLLQDPGAHAPHQLLVVHVGGHDEVGDLQVDPLVVQGFERGQHRRQLGGDLGATGR